MKYSTYFYYADYQIIELGNIKYIYCPKSVRELDVEDRFDTKEDTKKLFESIVKLNLEDEEEILEFTSEYGLLINTQNDPDHPTYCGKSIPDKINEYISPAATGFSLSLNLFKYFIELIRNILHLSTDIALYSNYVKKANSSSEAHEDYKNNILNIVKYCLSLLYQPYATKTTIIDGINLVFDGDTPLSRFAYNYHEALLGFLLITPNNPIWNYNHSLLSLCKKNTELKQQFDSKNHDGNITFESEIPELELDDRLNIAYIMSKKDFDAFILSDNFFKQSSRERQASIVKARDSKKTSNDTDASFISFSVTHSIAPDYKYKNKSVSPASDTLYYKAILNILDYLENFFDLDFHDSSKFEVSLKSTIKPDDTLLLMEMINMLSRELIIETINSFTPNINYRLDADENDQYHVTLVSESLLQSIFLKMSDILNKYNIAICKERNCKRPFLSRKSRPAQCCCHNHLTNYLRYKERHSYSPKSSHLKV